MALITWLPMERAEVESVALPELRVTAPSEADPSEKVTVPVAAVGETVAVKVTDWPKVEGLTLEVRLVVELALTTMSTTALEVLGR